MGEGVHSDSPRHRLAKLALFCLLVVLHAAFLLIPLHSAIPVPARADFEALQLLTLPPPPTALESAASAAATSRRRLPRPSKAKEPPESLQLQPSPPAPAPPADPAPIDWIEEAQSVAQRQAKLAELPPRRPLDDRERHDLAADKPGKPAAQFGWDPVRGHRVDMSHGALVVRLNDRCAIVLMPLPILGCGLGGEIPVRGDLFDHMRDAPAWSAPASPAP